MASPRPRGSTLLLCLYALACIGGAIAYVPVLTLLMPIKVETIAASARVELLSAVTIVGAIVASIAAIGFGWASDRSYRRHGSRRGWIAGGVVATCLSFAGIGMAEDPPMLVAAIVGFQLAVNLLLAPLAAVMADTIPDAQKGLVGVLVALAAPVASSVTLAVTALGSSEPERLAAVGLVVALCVIPLLAVRFAPLRDADAPPGADRAIRRGDMIRLSLGRLLVQIAGTTLFTYLLFYFETLPDYPPGSMQAAALPIDIARLTMLAYLIATPIGLIAGRWSDLLRRRKPFLILAALIAAAGLAIMAAGADATSAAWGFGLYIVASTVFLGLQTGFVVQVLPSSCTRGRDLGIVNLANTVPSLISATLAWSIVGPYGYPMLLALLAALVVLGGILTLGVRSEG